MDSSSISEDIRKSVQNGLSLECDAKLLQYMEIISNKLINRAKTTCNNIDTMSTELQRTSISLDNVINRLSSLSHTKFVENRVYEDDETIANIKEVPAEIKTKEYNPIKTLNTVMKNNLKMLDNCYEKVSVELDDSDEEDEQIKSIVYRPKNKFETRPIPHLIGTKEWKEKWHIGIYDSDESFSENENEEFSDGSDSISLRSNGPTISESGSSVWSINRNSKTNIISNKRNEYTSSDGEMSTTSKTSSSDNKQQRNIKNIPEIPSAPAQRYYVHQTKEKGLFDESSESENENRKTYNRNLKKNTLESLPSIIKQQSVVPNKISNIFNDEPPKLDDVEQKKNKIPSTLFCDSEEEELFNQNENKTAKLVQIPISQSDNVRKKTVNLFDDDDYNSFMKELDEKTSDQIENKNINLFDDQNEEKTKSVTKSIPEIPNRKVNLFDDQIEKETKPDKKIPEIFDKNLKLLHNQIIDKINASKITSSHKNHVEDLSDSNKIEKNGRPNLFEDDDEDDLFSSTIKPTTKVIPKSLDIRISNTKISNLFDDTPPDDEFDNLFKTSSSTSKNRTNSEINAISSSSALLSSDIQKSLNISLSSSNKNIFNDDDNECIFKTQTDSIKNSFEGSNSFNQLPNNIETNTEETLKNISETEKTEQPSKFESIINKKPINGIFDDVAVDDDDFFKSLINTQKNNNIKITGDNEENYTKITENNKEENFDTKLETAGNKNNTKINEDKEEIIDTKLETAENKNNKKINEDKEEIIDTKLETAENKNNTKINEDKEEIIDTKLETAENKNNTKINEDKEIFDTKLETAENKNNTKINEDKEEIIDTKLETAENKNNTKINVDKEEIIDTKLETAENKNNTKINEDKEEIIDTKLETAEYKNNTKINEDKEIFDTKLETAENNNSVDFRNNDNKDSTQIKISDDQTQIKTSNNNKFLFSDEPPSDDYENREEISNESNNNVENSNKKEDILYKNDYQNNVNDVSETAVNKILDNRELNFETQEETNRSDEDFMKLNAEKNNEDISNIDITVSKQYLNKSAIHSVFIPTIFDDTPPDDNDVIFSSPTKINSHETDIFESTSDNFSFNKATQNTPIVSNYDSVVFQDIIPPDDNQSTISTVIANNDELTKSSIQNLIIDNTFIEAPITHHKTEFKKNFVFDDEPPTDIFNYNEERKFDENMENKKSELIEEKSISVSDLIKKASTVSKQAVTENSNFKPTLSTKKLSTNFNINVAALIPGAKRPISSSVNSDELDGGLLTKLQPPDLEEVEIDINKKNTEKSQATEIQSDQNRLISLNKNRVKIPKGKRPSTKCGRIENYKKSLANDDNNINNVEDVDNINTNIETDCEIESKNVEQEVSKSISFENQNSLVSDKITDNNSLLTKSMNNEEISNKFENISSNRTEHFHGSPEQFNSVNQSDPQTVKNLPFLFTDNNENDDDWLFEATSKSNSIEKKNLSNNEKISQNEKFNKFSNNLDDFENTLKPALKIEDDFTISNKNALLTNTTNIEHKTELISADKNNDDWLFNATSKPSLINKKSISGRDKKLKTEKVRDPLFFDEYDNNTNDLFSQNSVKSIIKNNEIIKTKSSIKNNELLGNIKNEDEIFKKIKIYKKKPAKKELLQIKSDIINETIQKSTKSIDKLKNKSIGLFDSDDDDDNLFGNNSTNKKITIKQNTHTTESNKKILNVQKRDNLFDDIDEDDDDLFGTKTNKGQLAVTKKIIEKPKINQNQEENIGYNPLADLLNEK